MSEVKRNIVQEKSYSFAIRIIKLSQFQVNEKKKYVLSNQILRSGTSIGANIEEAIGGISKKDFTSKMSISYKEARETHYWLRLLHDTDFISKDEFKSLINDCEELLKLLFAIINSSKSSN